MNGYLKYALAACAAIGLSAAASAQEKLKVGFVYVGPVGDFGYSYQHDQGRIAMQKALGDKVESTFLENVAENDSERAIEQLARSGHNLIFTTSFGFMEPTLRVARKFPKVRFEHATGFKRAANVATYSARFYEGRYILGQIAGKMTKTNTLGYVAAFPIPEVVSGINSFYLGAKSVNPDVKIKIVWANTWFDPGRESESAKALMAQGADIISQHTDSAAPLQEAEKAGKLAFGQASDMTRFAPKAQLTSIIDDWSGYYIERVNLALAGKWKADDTWGGLKSGMVVMAPFANMPADVKALAEKTTAAISDGTLFPFACPVVDQSGKTVECKGGKTLSDEQILSMNWYVQGIDDKVPQ
ncbi:MAG: BMP family ABC transporter substrate-binding protein [Beijerinckiaceae bacterium]|jgi:basic membrane protein A and related proteins|nr:BMP family ABC transporter substrate-binding protein [Beijerinckiaceae bacterium]MDO9441667.1 BMP family ABC transporter substrate-binding protein [Beijerinckiaceae bacterium]